MFTTCKIEGSLVLRFTVVECYYNNIVNFKKGMHGILKRFSNTCGTNHWLAAIHLSLLKDDKDYRDAHALLENNALSHVSQTTMKFLAGMKIKLFLTSPGSLISLPYEKVFGVLKSMV